jgi:hypothetical protein
MRKPIASPGQMADSPQHKLGDSGAIDDPSVTAVADEPAVVREKAPEIKPGDLLANRYQVEAVLGKGGSGVVLRAFDRSAQTLVAVKLLRPTLTHDPRWEKRFSRELRLGRPIRHPNVCRVFDIGDADGYRFLTMELATGGTLRELIKRNQPLRPIDERLADAAGIVGGLAAIHEAGIVHRDVKTDNILRMEDGRLVLSDFGLATDLPTATMVSVFVGTPHYMAPEVREGEPATTRSDVWSLGVVLHEIFFGRRPERRTSRSGAGVSSRTTPPTSSLLERAMLAICERCLAADPSERPVDAKAVASLFEAARKAPNSIRLGRIRRTRRGAAVIAGVAIAAAVVAIYAPRPGKMPALDTKAIIQRLEANGKATDWSTVTAPVALGSGRVHCFSIIDDRTARLVIGTPRRAEDVDLASGVRRKSTLRPETYQTGCPQLSPDRSALLFSAHTTEGASEIRLSTDADGSQSKSITSGADPLWLANNREFVYEVDSSHAAVFSLPTMSLALVPGSGLGGRFAIADKAVGPRPDLIALLLLSDNAEWAVAIHEGKGFAHRETFFVPRGDRLQFDPTSEALYLPDNRSPTTWSLTSLDWRARAITRIGRYPGLEIVSAQRTSGELIVLTRRSVGDVWIYAGDHKRRLTTDGQNSSAAVSKQGDMLLGKRSEDGAFAIWWQGIDGGARRLTNGPTDVGPEFGPNGREWAYVDYRDRRIVFCTALDAACMTLVHDDMVPAGLKFSPDGHSLAYVTQIGTPQLVVMSIARRRSQVIGPVQSHCPPVWSSGTTLWGLEGTAKRYYWIERDAASGRSTGKRIDLGEDDDCWPRVTDQQSPFFQRVKVDVEQTSSFLSLRFDR